ncbi:MAG: peroxidase-related enzyme [Pseudomonadota bacterium]
MTHFSFSRRYNGVADVFLRSPDTYRSLLNFLEVVMVGESALSKIEREVLAARVSAINGCNFCVQAHVATLAAMGTPQSQLTLLKESECTVFGSSPFQCLLSFAEKLTRTPDQIVQRDIDLLTQSGLSEQSVEDAINVVALFNYVNRLVDAFGVTGNPRYFENVGQALARDGYAKLLPKRD